MLRGAYVVVAGVLALAGCTVAPGVGPSARASGADSATPSATSSTPAAVPGPTAGGIAKVLVVVEENHSLREMQSSMPYLSDLAQRYGYATAYSATTHPSLPNYLAIAGGSTFGVTDDAPPSAHPLSGPSVFGAALAAGRTARLYAESMPSPCDARSAGRYAVKHAPWAYFVDEAAQCRAGTVPAGTPTSGALAADIAAGRLPTVGMLVPDLDHDAHDGTLASADAWLRQWLPTILAGPDFAAGHLAIVVTADEDDRSAGNRVLTVVVAPGVEHQVVTAPLTHYSLTGLLCEVAGTAPLRAAVGAPSFAQAFGLRVSG